MNIPLKLSDNSDGIIYFQPVDENYECEVGIKDKLHNGLESALDNITDFASKVQESLIRFSNPDKASVEVSFGLTADAGKVVAVLLNSHSSASIKIKLEWNREKGRQG